MAVIGQRAVVEADEESRRRLRSNVFASLCPPGGLLDHVMFVYGYDADNLYIFETTETPIEYERLPGEFPHIMKLSKYEIRKRWTKFGRLWEVKME